MKSTKLGVNTKLIEKLEIGNRLEVIYLEPISSKLISTHQTLSVQAYRISNSVEWAAPVCLYCMKRISILKCLANSGGKKLLDKVLSTKLQRCNDMSRF